MVVEAVPFGCFAVLVIVLVVAWRCGAACLTAAFSAAGEAMRLRSAAVTGGGGSAGVVAEKKEEGDEKEEFDWCGGGKEAACRTGCEGVVPVPVVAREDEEDSASGEGSGWDRGGPGSFSSCFLSWSASSCEEDGKGEGVVPPPFFVAAADLSPSGAGESCFRCQRGFPDRWVPVVDTPCVAPLLVRRVLVPLPVVWGCVLEPFFSPSWSSFSPFERFAPGRLVIVEISASRAARPTPSTNFLAGRDGIEGDSPSFAVPLVISPFTVGINAPFVPSVVEEEVAICIWCSLFPWMPVMPLMLWLPLLLLLLLLPSVPMGGSIRLKGVGGGVAECRGGRSTSCGWSEPMCGSGCRAPL